MMVDAENSVLPFFLTADYISDRSYDLEQAFGVLRHHQRRCTGRKVAPSSLVIRGSVQLASAIATALHPFSAEDLSQGKCTGLATATL